MAILFLFIFHKFYAITAGFWRIFKFSANSCDKKHLNYDKFTVRFYVLSCQKFFLMIQYDIEEVVFMYFDKFLDLLKLAFRQKAAVYDAVEFFKKFFLNGFSIKKDFCRIHGRYRTARLSCA